VARRKRPRSGRLLMAIRADSTIRQRGRGTYCLVPDNHKATTTEAGMRNYFDAVSALLPPESSLRRLKGSTAFSFGYANTFGCEYRRGRKPVPMDQRPTRRPRPNPVRQRYGVLPSSSLLLRSARRVACGRSYPGAAGSLHATFQYPSCAGGVLGTRAPLRALGGTLYGCQRKPSNGLDCLRRRRGADLQLHRRACR